MYNGDNRGSEKESGVSDRFRSPQSSLNGKGPSDGLSRVIQIKDRSGGSRTETLS